MNRNLPRPRLARSVPWLICCAVFFTSRPDPGLAQFDNSSRASVYPDISIEAATHLRTAASYVSDQNWPEATELYQKVIERFGDKVVQVGTSPLFMTVRDFCHAQLAAMPAEAIEMYRQRVDAQAENWFKAGGRQRDRDLLQRVIDQAFVSSWGDDALDALAEYAFESGDFDQAAALWGLVHHVDRPGGQPQAPALPRLVYPDTNLDKAWIEAKQLLCEIFSGRDSSVAVRIAEYRRRYPAARGTLGGVEGLIADRLATIARETADAPASDDMNWATFAGNPSRNKVMPQSIDIGSVQWKAELPQVLPTRIGTGSRPMANFADELLAYHPLVLSDRVIVSSRDEVRAYDLHEGPKNGNEPVWTFRLRDPGGPASVMAARPSSGSPQYTLTAHRGRLYVRMGTPETTLPIRRGGQPDSHLVCLDLAADGKELWRTQPEPAEPDLAFEGSPLVVDGNVYIGVTRGGAMTHSFLACYDALTGEKKWRTLICESSSATSFFNAGSITHNLPTLGGGMVFYNTNLGAVAALDQRTGRVRWIATYHRKGRPETAVRPMATPSGRELSPCVYYAGTVFALPADGEGVHAFDALTGELRWKTPEPPNLLHLLGVAHGNLICSGNQVVAINVETGRAEWQWSDSGMLAGYGRGILAGDYVYFPTKTHVYILDQRTGVLAKRKEAGALQEKGQSPGNLVIGDGYLVVAQPTQLVVFCEYEILINRYRELISQRPGDPEPHLRLARAAEANEAIDLAVEHYRATIELASSDGPDGERALRQTARHQLHALLQQLAQRAAGSGDWLRAEEQWREAASVAPTSQGKLVAMLRRADMWAGASDGPKAIAAYQDILAEDALRGLGIAVDGNRTVRADVEISGRVNDLVSRFGRLVYASYDAEALELLSAARRDGSVESMERLVRTHPNSEAAAHALLDLAGRYVEQGELAAAASAYRKVLAWPQPPDGSRLAAMHGLAMADETRRDWPSAKLWWQRLAGEFPHAPAPAKPEQSVTSFVQERLAGSMYDAEREGELAPSSVPLARRWNRAWDDGHRILIPAGVAPTEGRLPILVSTDRALECIATDGDELLWTAKLGGPARWAAFHEDHLFVAGDTQLGRFSLRGGELAWEYHVSEAGAKLMDFQLADGRVFFREGSHAVICLAAASGDPLWSYKPTSGSIQPQPFFSTEHVALRTKEPAKFIVLDGDGRQRFETSQVGDAWEFAPVAVDAHRLCITSDSRTIQLVDLNDGKQVWSYTGPSSDHRPVPIAGPNSLVVLVAGHTLVRLDPDSGKTLWSVRVSDGALARYESAWAIDDVQFYCVTRELNVRAFRLADGTLAWEQFVVGPSDQWQLASGGEHLVALPRVPHGSEGLPVVICRRLDGRLLQRLFFRPSGTEAFVHWMPTHAFIGSDREMWLLRKEVLNGP